MNILAARARVPGRKNKRTVEERAEDFWNKKNINTFFLRDRWYMETFCALFLFAVQFCKNIPRDCKIRRTENTCKRNKLCSVIINYA